MTSLDQGKLIHATIIECGLESDVFVGNALIDMYAKCGTLGDACDVFEKLHVRDVVSWNAMIAGYANNGQYKSAEQLFETMQGQGIAPTYVTFISLLAACSHGGLVLEGRHYFRVMSENCGLTPLIQHYICMVDLLGRAGRLDEAKDLVLEMPLCPDSTAWMALLGSCAKCGDSELGKHAFDNMVNSDWRRTSAYVLMSNIYAANYMWDDAQKVQQMRA